MKLFSILLLTTFFLQSALSHGLEDSIGSIKMRGETYILHKVDPGQGWYSITKKYHVSKEVIIHENGDTIADLKLGQLLFIPYKKNKMVDKEIVHQVARGETLYNIANHYRVSVILLREWNHLGNDEIGIGQELLVHQKVEEEIPAADFFKKNEKVPKKKEDKELIQTGSSNEIQEEGIATWVDEPGFVSAKSLALHKYAPVGTIVKVVSLVTGNADYVKIVGNLPADAKELIKVSEYTARQLGIKDKMTRVQLYYFNTPAAEK